MKKLVIAGLIGLTILGAQANGYHHRQHQHQHRHHNSWGWVAPAIITGAVVYAATRPQAAQPLPPPVVYTQPPYGYHYETVLDANCNCYRTVLMPN